MVIELIAVEYGWPLGVVDEPRQLLSRRREDWGDRFLST